MFQLIFQRLPAQFQMLIAIGVVAVLASVPAFCQDTSSTIDAKSPKAAINRLDSYIEQARKQWQVPGVAVAVVHGDEVLLSKGYGVRDVRSHEDVDANTLFAIASNSKAFTAAALAILEDEGKVQWDDLVTKHLPWFRLHDTFASNDIRVRDLLCHRSGLGTFSGDLLWWGTDYSPRQILERAVHLEPESAFRSNYGYSNLMFLAAGEVIEAASGQSWSEFIRKRILSPLEMQRTTTSIRDLVALGNFATPHKTTLDASKPIAWMNWDSMAAAGGIISSVNDMSAWLRLQLRNGKIKDGQSLFSDDNAHEMWQSQIPIKVGKTPSARFPSTHFRSYGLGWSLSDYQGRKIVGHGGGYDGMYSQVLMVPEERIGVVVLTNSMTSITGLLAYRAIDELLGVADKDWSEENLKQFRSSREDFAKRIQDAVTPVATGTQPSHKLEDFTGTFRCPMYGDAVVELQDNHLVLKLLPYPALVADLKHLHYDTFEIRWRNEFAWFENGTAHFSDDAKGIIQRIDLNVPNEDLWFHELKLSRVSKDHTK